MAGKTVAALGLTFKPNTDDMRDAPSLVILPELAKRGAKVRAHDPVGVEEAKKLMPDLRYCDDAYDAIAGADVLVILTEWNSYRALDLRRIKTLMKAANIVDLRNISGPMRWRSSAIATSVSAVRSRPKPSCRRTITPFRAKPLRADLAEVAASRAFSQLRQGVDRARAGRIDRAWWFCKSI